MHRREALIEYFVKAKQQPDYTTFKNALNTDRYDLTDLFLRQGYDLNAKTAQSSFFFATINSLTKAVAQADTAEIEKFEKRLKYLFDKGLDPYLEDDYKRNSFFAVKRIKDKALKEKVDRIVKRIVN